MILLKKKWEVFVEGMTALRRLGQKMKEKGMKCVFFLKKGVLKFI